MMTHSKKTFDNADFLDALPVPAPTKILPLPALTKKTLSSTEASKNSSAIDDMTNNIASDPAVEQIFLCRC